MGISQNLLLIFRKEKRFLFALILVFLLVLASFVAITNWSERRAVAEQEKAFNDQQALQALLARQALEDYFRDLFADTRVLANYSLVQYKKSNLTPEFMFGQLTDSASPDPEYLGIFYLETPAKVELENIAPEQDQAAIRRTALEWAGRYWETVHIASLGQTPLIAPLLVTHTQQWFGLIYPVRVDGVFTGEMVVIDNLKPAIDRFIVPIRSGQYGAAYLIDGKGNILFDHETDIIGKNIFNGMHAGFTDVQRFDSLITSQTSGTGEYHFTVVRGGAVQRKLAAWNSVTLGNQKLVITLSAPDSEIDRNLSVLRDQRNLTGTLLLFATLVMMGMFFTARQRALERHAANLQSEVEDRSTALIQSQEALRSSNETLKTLVDVSPLPITLLDAENRVVLWNPAAEKMFGYSEEELCGLPNPIVPDDLHAEYDAFVHKVEAEGRMINIEAVRKRKDGSLLNVLFSTATLYEPANKEPAKSKMRGRMAIFTDITERKRHEEEVRISQVRLNAQVRIAQMKIESVTELLDIALEEALALTLSTVGYIYYYDEQRMEFILHAWSKDVMSECSIIQPTNITQLSDVGIWGEVVRQRKPLVLNDFQAPHPLKKGYPDGHVEISRFMSVPVFSSDKIVAVVGMGNKASDYTGTDVRELTLLMDSIWKTAERKEIEEKLRQNNARLAALDHFARTMAGGPIIDFQGTVDRVARFAAELFGDFCYVAVINPRQRAIKASSSWSINPEARNYVYAQGVPFHIYAQPVLEEVWHTGQIINMDESHPGWLPERLHSDALEFYQRFHPRSLVALPLNAQGNVIGAIILLRLGNRPAIYATEDAAFLQEFANRAALTIANAELNTENQRRLEHFQSLHTIEVAITSSLDVNNTLTMIVNQVVGQLHADAAAIILYHPQSQRLEFAAGCGFYSGAPLGSSVRMGEGLVGRVAREGQMLAIPRLMDSVEVRLPDYIAREGFMAYYGLPLIARGQLKGVLEVYQREQLNPDQEWMDILQTLGGQAAIAIDHAALFEDLQRSNFDLSMAYDETIEGLSRALDLRDNETEGHSQRVCDLTEKLAFAFHIPEMGIIHIRRGALLHDIGKLGIPDKILLKAGPLDEEEWNIMHKHPRYGYDILFHIHHLRPSLDIPYCHHEKWDGTGYPRGLKGTEIPLAARLFAVVDVFDALTSHRPYRPAWSREKALEYISAQAGTYFDPEVVQVFLKMMEVE